MGRLGVGPPAGGARRHHSFARLRLAARAFGACVGPRCELEARPHHSFARLRAVGSADLCWLADARRLAARAFGACGGSVRRACLLAALVAGTLACGHTSLPPQRSGGGVSHTVVAGETVWRLSKRYGVPIGTILRANGLDDVTQVPTGARLRLATVAGAGDATMGSTSRRPGARASGQRPPAG
jgi:hypothetical protein